MGRGLDPAILKAPHQQMLLISWQCATGCESAPLNTHHQGGGVGIEHAMVPEFQSIETVDGV